MCQEHLPAAVPCKAELFHDIGFLGLGHGGSIEVGPLPVSIPLKFLKSALVEQPLVGQTLAAVHASHGNDHRTYPMDRF